MGSLRIVGGAARGRRLRSPTGATLRPTSARVREALFDIIQARIQGARFLDLFAGTGAVGIEALSRGAAAAVFVESSRAAGRLIEKNLVACGFTDRGTVVSEPLPAALRRLKTQPPFDLIFADPPYGSGDGEAVLRGLTPGGVFHPGTWVFLEQRRTGGVPARPGGLLHRRTFRYGDTVLLLYVPAGESPEAD